MTTKTKKKVTKKTTKKKAPRKRKNKAISPETKGVDQDTNEQTHRERTDEHGTTWIDYFWRGYFTGSVRKDVAVRRIRNVKVVLSNGNEGDRVEMSLFSSIHRLQEEFPNATRKQIFTEAKNEMRKEFVTELDLLTLE